MIRRFVDKPQQEPIKKLSKDFLGKCELRQLPRGTIFKIIKKDGNLSKETYIKGAYYAPKKTFEGIKFSDVWGNARDIKGTQLVSTNFDC